MKPHLGLRSRSFALIWWLVNKTNSATAMGAVMVFNFVPTLIFLLIGGVAVDRFDRVKAMLVSDLGRFLIALALLPLAAANQLTIVEIYAGVDGFQICRDRSRQRSIKTLDS